MSSLEWKQLKASLEAFKLLSVRPRTPSNIRFHSGSILFLAPVSLDSATCTVYSLSLSTGIASPLLDQTEIKEQAILTAQQILLRERMRTTASEITSFSLSSNGMLVFLLGPDVFSGQAGSLERGFS
jgi:hypothetical protein